MPYEKVYVEIFTQFNDNLETIILEFVNHITSLLFGRQEISYIEWTIAELKRNTICLFYGRGDKNLNNQHGHIVLKKVGKKIIISYKRSFNGHHGSSNFCYIDVDLLYSKYSYKKTKNLSAAEVN